MYTHQLFQFHISCDKTNPIRQNVLASKSTSCKTELTTLIIMVQLINQLCETLEAVMTHEPTQENVQNLSNATLQLMQQTNNILQKNLYNWDENLVDDYSLRIHNYGRVSQAFASILHNKPTQEIIDLGIHGGDDLYNQVSSEYFTYWSKFNETKRKEIIEEILVPHMLLIRFLKKYRETNFKSENQEEWLKRNFNPQQLGFLFNALLKNLFPRPNKGEILVESYEDYSCTLHFTKEYFSDLTLSVSEASKAGKFASSNSEREWINLMAAIENSNFTLLPDKKLLTEYSVHK